jgi:hypothetical protein
MAVFRDLAHSRLGNGETRDVIFFVLLLKDAINPDR